MRDMDLLFTALAKSAFRQRFHLRSQEREYLDRKGLPTVLEHAGQFVGKRLVPAYPANDGKQTPFRGHPVFVAQHATGTCCRSCLEKWHDIRKGVPLSDAEQAHVVKVIERWITEEIS
jgi:Domain of unknown function (DUF4186)